MIPLRLNTHPFIGLSADGPALPPLSVAGGWIPLLGSRSGRHLAAPIPGAPSIQDQLLALHHHVGLELVDAREGYTTKDTREREDRKEKKGYLSFFRSGTSS